MFNRREIQNAGTPVPLFALSPNGYYEIAADGRRFPVNIIPAEASATLDCRLLPGENSALFVAKLQELVKGTDIEIHPIVLGESSSSPIDTELFRAIAKVASSYDKGALVTTPLLPSSTDSTYFRKLGITCYGFEPFKLTEEQELGHAHNERISVSSFLGGVRRMYDLVLAMQ